ncbi:MAG: phage tail protein [Clostridiales bacterium]|nr:phage tail protein [Clostridiales bacterium]
MIKVFSPTDKDFSTNGDRVINATYGVVHKVENGDYYLELSCLPEYAEYLKAGNLVVVPTPQGEQAFRLEAPIESTGTRITFKAWHIFYDSDNYIIADSYVVRKNCNDALNHLNNATDQKSPFTVYSDISKEASFRCVRKSLGEAVNTVLERWGGHLVRDNFRIEIRNVLGEDNGVTIQYKKNLKEITVSESWEEVCTKCLPVGKDGQLLDGLYVYASKQYDIPYSKVVEITQDINEEDYPDHESYIRALKADLRAQAEAYLEVAQYPTINYTLSANIEKITDVGDIVRVYDERLGVDILASVVSFDYDIIQEKYIEIEFGSLNASLSDLLTGINTQVTNSLSQYTADINEYLQGIIEVAVAEIWEALGSSYCIFNGDELLVVDRLPAQYAINVMRIDQRGIAFSTNGITGTFTTVWNLENEFDFSKITPLNLTLSLLSGGTLEIGGSLNEKGAIVIKDNSNNNIVTMNNSGISANDLTIDGSSLLGMLFFSASDTCSIDFSASGYIGADSETLVFSIPLPKSTEKLSSASLTELKLNVRTGSGSFLFGSFVSGGYDVLDDATLSASVTLSGSTAKITVSTSSPWSASLENTPVSVMVEASTLAFS